MSEQDSVIDAPLTEPTPVEQVATEPQADAADDATKTTDTAEPGEGHDDHADTDPAELPKGVKKRIDTLTRQKYEREARIAELEAKLAAQQPQPKEPQPQDFADLETYLDAKAEYLAQQKISTAQSATAQHAAIQEKAESFSQRAASIRATAPDFDAVIAAVPPDLLKPEMAETILDMEEGPQVAYHLATNLHECARIAAMSGRQQAMELGKLAARLVAPKVVPKPAPAPAPRVRTNSAPVEKSVSQMSDAEYREFRRKQDIAAGRLRR